jgi:hypothetical protein
LPQVVERPSGGEFHDKLEFGNAVNQVFVVQVVARSLIAANLNSAEIKLNSRIQE